MPINLPATFLQGWYFKILCVTLVAAVLWWFYRLRISQVEVGIRARLYERLAERERIARDLHDTFFQGIQGLLLSFNLGTNRLAKVRLTDTSDCQEWRNEPRRLVLGSPSSVELAGALKSKSRSLPGFLIVQLQAPDIEPSSSNRILYVGDIGLTHSLRVSGSVPIENGCLYERSRPAWPTSGGPSF